MDPMPRSDRPALFGGSGEAMSDLQGRTQDRGGWRQAGPLPSLRWIGAAAIVTVAVVVAPWLTLWVAYEGGWLRFIVAVAVVVLGWLWLTDNGALDDS